MKPNKKFVTIFDNENQIKQLLLDLVLEPRIKALEWSKITKQTPNMKVGYPGQHLASLVLGMEGAKTGARGNDIVDGSEVKSCSRVDQLDSCKDCNEKILRTETVCPSCKSKNIERMNDSKWLFTIRNENDLKVLTKDVDRIVLALADYPDFDKGNFEDLRFQVFEIWTKSARNKHFITLMTNYYEKIYLSHKIKNPKKTPAPKNFWPYSFQFYMCNPIKILDCIVENANLNPQIIIKNYVSPLADRSKINSENMPIAFLNKEELLLISQKTQIDLDKINTKLPFLSEKQRLSLSLRDTDRISEAKQPYQRS
ncbi:MAG: MamI family restriction endonuclease [Bacteroidetes bacterium]|nr:MAG: MamI family restriction endonuclease [Bacteroidota bacterium]